MQKFIYKASTAISTISLLTWSFAGMAGATVTGTAGNDTTGADSNNEANIDVQQSTFVDQQNQGTVVNKIDLNANTGGNTANKNTGEGSISTGDVKTGTSLSTTLNKNAADIDPCGGCDLDLYASNEKTGADSNNETSIEVDKATVLEQDNNAHIKNEIFQDLNTGDNEANKNTGMGSITTGGVESVSVVNNKANKNMASVGHNGGGAGDPTLTAGNDTTGADSNNQAHIDVSKADWVVQSNYADILNDAEILANTGWNEANENTGEGAIETGDIYTGVGFDTMANANFLAYDGCCDVELAAGNFKTGADSNNETSAELTTLDTIFQGNCAEEDGVAQPDILGGHHHHGLECGVANLVFGALNTGENTTNENTADGIDSGDVEAGVEVTTQENENVLGNTGWDWPDVEWDASNLPDSGSWWMLFFGFSA